MTRSKQTRRRGEPTPTTAGAQTGSARWVLIFCAALPVAAAVLLFLPTLRYGFIWDDPLVLEQMRAMHGLRDLLVPPDIVPRFYYRPFIFATFLLDRALGGGGPLWFHATGIFWHAVATGLVFLLARSLLGARRLPEACCAALLFAVHPVHVESVAWIAGRSDVIATCFVVAAVLLGARTDRQWTAWAAGGALFLGLLSKEVALTGLLLVPLRDFLVDRRVHPTRYIASILAVGLYFLLRANALGTFGGGVPTGATASEVSRELLAAVGWYASKLLFPAHLNAYVQEVPSGAAYPLGGMVVLVLGIVAAVGAWRAKQRCVLYLLCWLPLTLAPSLTVILRRSASALVADRYLYLPSVAAVVLVGWGLGRLRSWQSFRLPVGAASVGLITVIAALASASRSHVWADDVTFWSDVADKSPRFALPHRELADAYMRRNNLDAAERAFERALEAEARPEDTVMTYNNLGNLYLRRGRLDEASRAFEAGLVIYPHPHLYNGLGRVAMRRAEAAQARGDRAEAARQVMDARAALEKAVAGDPRDYRSHVLLGQVLLSLGRREEARNHLETALAIEPTGAIADIARRYLAAIGS